MLKICGNPASVLTPMVLTLVYLQTDWVPNSLSRSSDTDTDSVYMKLHLSICRNLFPHTYKPSCPLSKLSIFGIGELAPTESIQGQGHSAVLHPLSGYASHSSIHIIYIYIYNIVFSVAAETLLFCFQLLNSSSPHPIPSFFLLFIKCNEHIGCLHVIRQHNPISRHWHWQITVPCFVALGTFVGVTIVSSQQLSHFLYILLVVLGTSEQCTL